ncbi:GRB10-interacting GYF protein 2 isoform X2 [Bombina bombina]|uniref:GRB10-interacting GYF protein 2 isoform X2 n=1 Tax=Bombina bombina TaxID=8345 RepID=UPI00235A66F6|nr:GRB10-interacting GYF protein 2 isoform X2 [Bombina bombina]
MREELNGEEEEGGGVWRTTAPRRDGERWRAHSPDGARGSAWREHPDRRRRFDFDFREREDERYRRTRSGSGSAEDERDSLPEWCLEDAEDETGTFDSSGAFLPSKMQKEIIPEEQELDFRPSLESEERSDSDKSHLEETKETERSQAEEQEIENVVQTTTSVVPEHRAPSPTNWTEPCIEPLTQTTQSPRLANTEKEIRPQTPPAPPTPPNRTEVKEKILPDAASHVHQGIKDKTVPSIPHSHSAFSQSSASRQVPDTDAGSSMHSSVPTVETSTRPVSLSVSAAPGMQHFPPLLDEEDGLEHLEQQAQQLVAYLQDGTPDDDRLPRKLPDHRIKGSSLDNQKKWYYKDPQGDIQGPFSNQEMSEWFQAGYFPMSLLLRRVCDEAFQPLADIIKIWGRVPFNPGPSPRINDLNPERLSCHQDITALYQLQHLQYQQFLIQQQYAQVLAQQQKAALSAQQQQQLAVLLQQFQSLKLRISEQSVIPTVARAVSVPENTSMWEVQTAVPPPTVWEGNSVWDLPVEVASQGASREQLEQLEKVKTAKMEQERREAELRAKQEEEEQRKRHEEEERKRKEEEDLARRKQEEALRRQREQELALRRQREEEERKKEEELRQLEERKRQEDERRRHEEERKRYEEERQRQEEDRRRQEEERRRLEEEKRAEEERRRLEEERKQREEIQRKQEEAARWAREEEEAVRRLLDTRQRQEEEERKKREEAQRQKELQRQRQQQQEALRRLQQQQQQQQMAQMKLPTSSTWGQQASSGGTSQSALSLAEIQKLEEEREHQQQEELQRQQQELKALQHQQQQQQQKMSGWGTVSKPSATTKSLLEIQQEEARQMQNHQQLQPAGRTKPASLTIPPVPVNTVSTNNYQCICFPLNTSTVPKAASV